MRLIRGTAADRRETRGRRNIAEPEQSRAGDAGVAIPCCTRFVMSIANKKVFIPRPPDKGSFPLDHDGECRDDMIKYLECLQANKLDASPCRDLTQKVPEMPNGHRPDGEGGVE